MASKREIKDAYIAALKRTYSHYADYSRPLDMAHKAADDALAGRLKLTGDCWFEALESFGLPRTITMRALSELPA